MLSVERGIAHRLIGGSPEEPTFTFAPFRHFVAHFVYARLSRGKILQPTIDQYPNG